MPVAADGEMIAESSIIIEYLDYRFAAGTRLIPSDPDRARRTRFDDCIAELCLNESVTTLHREGLQPEAPCNSVALAKAQARFRMSVRYDYLDHHLSDKTPIMGDDFTRAD
jgi:glutathione S-transferase